MATSPTVFRRFVLGLAYIGLDIRPGAKRFRNAILRPHRAEVDARFRQVEFAQREIGADLSAVHGHIASLRQRGEAEREALRAQIIALDQTIGATIAEHRAAVAEHAAAIATLQDWLNLSRTTLANLTQALGESDARARQALAIKEAEIAALREAAAAEGNAWRDRVFRLETLLIDSSPVRLPGAEQAVAQLPNPAVAVILPTYNRTAIIGDAVASVQAQTFQNWELIIVDDGSEDDIGTALAPFLTDSRIRLYRQQKSGASTARNHGIKESTAPFIAYIDSDNVWYPNFLARAVDHLATDPEVDLVYGALVTDDHDFDRNRILWSTFDREALLSGNFIDTNMFVHRRRLVDRYGGWDPTLGRLLDWDLLLRYTVDKPAKPIGVIAGHYRRCDDQRISKVVPAGPDEVAIWNKWFPPPLPTRRPRVLYVVWHYPQLSESYIETELLCMLAWGVQVEVWRSADGVSRYPTCIPVHDGTLAEAIGAARPDIIHVHWLGFALNQSASLAESHLPVTLRLHGFDVTPERLGAWLAHDWVKNVYAYPHQIAEAGLSDPRLIPMPAAFDSKLFKPSAHKDRRLVVRTSAALPSKDLELFLQVAERFPDHRFTLAAVTCHRRESYVDELKSTHDRLKSPAEIRFDVPRAEVSALLMQSSIYLHTVHPQDHDAGTPVGQPLSIIEAMATGCYCLVKDVPALAALVGDAGATYRDIDELTELIRATEAWTEEIWVDVQHRAIRRAWLVHADTIVFRRLFNDWMALAAGQILAGTEGEG